MKHHVSIGATLVFCFITGFFFQAGAQPVNPQNNESQIEPAEPQKKSFFDNLLEIGIGATEQVIEKEVNRGTRKVQGYYKGKIESINVVEQRGNSIVTDISYRGIEQYRDVQLKVKVLRGGYSSQEFSSTQANIDRARGVARVTVYWNNPMDRAEFRSDQIEVLLYRNESDADESLDRQYVDMYKTWTPYSDLVDQSGQTGDLVLDDELVDVEELGEAPASTSTGSTGCSSRFIWKENHWVRRLKGDTTCYPNQPSGSDVVRDDRTGSSTPPVINRRPPPPPITKRPPPPVTTRRPPPPVANRPPPPVTNTRARYVEIQHIKGRCLDVAGGKNADRTNVQIYQCNGSNSQKWYWSSKKEIRNKMGRCLDVAGGRNADKTNIQIYNCNGSRSQQFELLSTKQIKNKMGRCLDIVNGKNANGTNVQLYKCKNKTEAQKWVHKY